MTVLYNYQAAVSEYQKLLHEGSLAEWLFDNRFATSELTAVLLASALRAPRDTGAISEWRYGELEKQIIERIDDLNFADKLHRVKLDLVLKGCPRNEWVEDE